MSRQWVSIWYPLLMLDWIGSLRIHEQSKARVVLALSPTTQIVGGVLLAVGLYLILAAWVIWPWFALAPALLSLFGIVLLSLRRQLVVDRDAGVLRVEQRAFGIKTCSTVPLFHLRAVVVMARPGVSLSRGVATPISRYVAYLERRVGESIYLDEARRCATLLRLAEAIAEVAELRLEYDASAKSD